MYRIPVLLIAIALLPAAEDFLWVEGEAYDHGQDAPHPWYSKAIDAEQLSGGAFASSFTKQGPVQVGYDLQVSEPGDYALWLRANPTKATLQWRIDRSDWQAVDFSRAGDRVNIAKDGKPDLRYLAWVQAGTVALRPGRHRLDIRFASKNHHHGSLDCFVLTTGPFVPNGKQRPDQAATEADEGWFAVSAPVDPFTDEALVDLRHLNEETAGMHGPLQRAGDRFELGDGMAVRLWGANAGPARNQSAQDYLARRLAKAGFNCARLHGLIADRSGGDGLDRQKLDRVHYAVQAYRQQGIYTHLSTYFPLWLKLKNGESDYGRVGERPTALLFIDPTFQELYKAWAKELLTSENPYTGLSLAEDPAVAFFELQNEDNLFFYTFQEKAVGPKAWAAFERRYAAWLQHRYGSLAKARASWGGATHKHDDPGADRMGLYGAWHHTRDGLAKAGGKAKRARLSDEVRFLAELQRATYTELTRFIREDCGFRGLIVAGNWKAADDATMRGVDRWTTAVADCIDKHGYFGAEHEGEASGYSVRQGHRFGDRSALRHPAESPVGYLQIAGYPHIVTETAWPKPNRLNADGVLLLSSYGSLQGIDGYFLFATHDGGWSTGPTEKWPLISPSHYAQSMAAALQYRRGDIAQPEPVVQQVVRADEQFDFRQGGIIEGRNDDFRVPAITDIQRADRPEGFDPLSYFVGPVWRFFPALPGTPRPRRGEQVDLRRHIDHDAGVVRSVTGELVLDSGAGLLQVDSPRSQAVSGYLKKAGRIALTDVTVNCDNDYATVHVISLDGEPLATSQRILVQAYSQERLYGFRSRKGVIETLGRAPWNVEEIDATVQLPSGAWRATICDPHGYPRDERRVATGRFRLPEDALYTVLER